jgi:hypothetical protein
MATLGRADVLNARDTGYTVLGKNLGDDQFVISISRTL